MAVPSGVVKTEVEIPPGGPRRDTLHESLPPYPAEQGDRLGRQRDRAPTEVRLRLPERHTLPGESLRHLLDVCRRTIKVNGTPPEAEQLATP